MELDHPAPDLPGRTSSGIRPRLEGPASRGCGSPEASRPRRPTVAIVGSRAPRTARATAPTRLGGPWPPAGDLRRLGPRPGDRRRRPCGALEGGGPTIGISGRGHRHFFPRAQPSAREAMIDAGGAVALALRSGRTGVPSQFLQRNGDRRRARRRRRDRRSRARSGALNTASWAAATLIIGAGISRRRRSPESRRRNGCNAARR
jgi:hypothetical protein